MHRHDDADITTSTLLNFLPDCQKSNEEVANHQILFVFSQYWAVVLRS